MGVPKFDPAMTLAEFQRRIDELGLGLEIRRYRRVKSEHQWNAEVTTSLDERPERSAEATAESPWKAIEMALRQISRIKRGTDV
jgi:ribosome-associated translation inhibitor RaiA